ncbi:2-C-methyl-D-erythritol 4-phosphate cytidylyltransferase [Nocardioides sp. SYSU D00038]|uniref:2-C-methyl-D-erythritol 4-phosphate cytidylyltransferase n=1 Tax=Nocardioides sp. SYSU D00038 TaxID=2812554 RepID=UPI00196862EF|nr:2-C-methyl-D-erythritol 4-phosphate cytidylyltransferase [Nocardioides sp. SYSU D00038]
MDVETVPALGTVVEQERGSLPFELVHGEALVACAAWALGDAGVTAVDLGTGWDALVAAGEPFVLHDALCPMTPAGFVAACVERAVAADVVVVGVRPVTDTVKLLGPGDPPVVGETVDRDALTAVASPVVLPASVVSSLDGLPSLDFAVLVAALAARFPVEAVPAPAEARRVTSVDDVRVLEAQTRPGGGPPR